MQLLSFINEIVLSAQGIDQILDVLGPQLVHVIEIVGLEVVDLPDLPLQLPHLVDVLSELVDVKGLQLLEALPHERLLHQLFINQ